MGKVEFMGLSACLYLLGCLECWLSPVLCWVCVCACQCMSLSALCRHNRHSQIEMYVKLSWRGAALRSLNWVWNAINRLGQADLFHLRRLMTR